jgi:HAD superfamily hydrolase (TIGR01509 family)
MAIKALIFDFDGLILDTEVPEFQSWQELYQKFGFALTLEVWSQNIGSYPNVFEPAEHLQKLANHQIQIDDITRLHHQRADELLLDKKILPGVDKYIERAKELGLKIGVASSSTQNWVIGNLSRLGLASQFDCIYTANDVTHTKPDPELYLRSIDKLKVLPCEAIAFEDSPNGIKAAKEAGLFCVAVPNALTRNLNLDQADLILGSLAEITLDNLLLSLQAA